MKKITILASAVCILGAVQASAASFPVVFNGTDSEGWTYGDQAILADGHLKVDMTDNGGKYRQDLTFTSSSAETDYTVDASEMKYFAIKFIGTRPAGNMTLEIQYRDSEGVHWMNSQWKNKPQGDLITNSGNNVYYYDLAKDEAWTGTLSIDKIVLKIADCTTPPYDYTLDWINLFRSVEDIDVDWKDDGASDADEAQKVDSPVMIGDAGYSTLSAAFDAAVDGDIIIVNENQAISARLGVDARNITIKGGKEGVVITRAFNKLIFLTNSADGSLTLEDLILDGANMEGSCSLEASGHASLTLNNVSFKNFMSDNGQGVISVKNGGKIEINNVEFEGSSVPEGRGEIFIGANGSTISGNNVCTIYLEKQCHIAAVELANAAPVKLFVDDDRAFTVEVTETVGEGDEAEEVTKEVNSILVLNCIDTTQFSMGTTAFMIKADEELNALILAENDGSGVEAIATETTDAPAEYYNLQGMKVAADSLVPGIYVCRQGSKATKVLVK